MFDPAPRQAVLQALAATWGRKPRAVVLEIGFDAGLSVLAALQHWRDDPQRCAQVHWVSWLPEALAHTHIAGGLQAAACPPSLADALLAVWPPALPGLYRRSLQGVPWWISLAMGRAAQVFNGCVQEADFLLVGLAETPLPEEAAVLRRAVQMLALNAPVCVRPLPGQVLRSERLEAVRAAIESAGGRLDSTHDDVWLFRRQHGRSRIDPVRATDASRALVVGGGLAGVAVAFSLARRGWQVDRLEGAVPAASLQPVLAQHPSLSIDDAPLSQMTRAATLLSEGDPALRSVMRWEGRIQLADPQTVASVCAGMPRDWVEGVDARQASERAGIGLRQGGWWLPRVGSVEPLSLREAWTPSSVQVQSGALLALLTQQDGEWLAQDHAGQLLARAPLAVLAPGAGDVAVQAAHEPQPRTLSERLATAGLQWRAGQSTIAQVPDGQVPRCIVGGVGHAVRLDAHRLLLGPGPQTDTGEACAAAWSRWIAGQSEPHPAIRLVPGPRGIRLSTRDHLPLIGPVPAAPLHGFQDPERPRSLSGLWMAWALGGRGLLWASLAGELITARLMGEPLPLSPWLAARLDPLRFLKTT